MTNKNDQINLRVTKTEKEKIKFLSKEYGYDKMSEFIIKSSLGIIDKKNINKKINTLTLNPAIDYIIKTNNKLEEITNFSPNEKVFEPGGKGINASLIINEFNIRTLAIHYSNGFTGDLLKNKLDKLNIQQLQVKSSFDTRMNLKLNFGNKNYEINSLAVPLTTSARNSILKTVMGFSEGETLMIMGSFYKTDEDFIIELSKLCVSKKIELVFDLSKPFIKELLKYKPLIVKPNREELEWIFDTKIKTDEDIIVHMNKLKTMGAKNVAVTLGKEGSYLLDEKNNLFKAIVDPIKLSSPQGSGDSFLSTFVVKINKGSEEAFVWANAAGAATAQLNGLADYPLIQKTLEKITIKKL